MSVPAKKSIMRQNSGKDSFSSSHQVQEKSKKIKKTKNLNQQQIQKVATQSSSLSGESDKTIELQELDDKIQNNNLTQAVQKNINQKNANFQNINEDILTEFNKLLKVYTATRDFGRRTAYRNAISTIEGLKFQITKQEQVKNLPGIGKKIYDKIGEILSTGKLKKADNLFENDKNRILMEFSDIWGVGSVKAKELYDSGFRSIQDLKTKNPSLNQQQKIGLKYYDDIQLKMSRQEAQAIVDTVIACIAQIEQQKGLYEATACGSFRRGKSQCGDVDIIFKRSDDKYFGNFLSQLVNKLKEQKFLVEDLTHPKDNGPKKSQSYMGICKVANSQHFRRIDLKIYPSCQYGLALLTFTGSSSFNIEMRKLAQEKGGKLSDHELVLHGKSIECHTEQEVFDALKIQYRPPEQRS